MDKDKLKKIEKLLMKMKGEILKGFSGPSFSEEREEGWEAEVGDAHDTFVASREKEFKLLMGDRERKKLLLIDEALQRIKNGEYGVCEECGEEIPFERLKVMPFTKVCVECQERIERDEEHLKKMESEKVFRNIPIDDFNIEE